MKFFDRHSRRMRWPPSTFVQPGKFASKASTSSSVKRRHAPFARDALLPGQFLGGGCGHDNSLSKISHGFNTDENQF